MASEAAILKPNDRKIDKVVSDLTRSIGGWLGTDLSGNRAKKSKTIAFDDSALRSKLSNFIKVCHTDINVISKITSRKISKNVPTSLKPGNRDLMEGSSAIISKSRSKDSSSKAANRKAKTKLNLIKKLNDYATNEGINSFREKMKTFSTMLAKAFAETGKSIIASLKFKDLNKNFSAIAKYSVPVNDEPKNETNPLAKFMPKDAKGLVTLLRIATLPIVVAIGVLGMVATVWPDVFTMLTDVVKEVVGGVLDFLKEALPSLLEICKELPSVLRELINVCIDSLIRLFRELPVVFTTSLIDAVINCLGLKNPSPAPDRDRTKTRSPFLEFNLDYLRQFKEKEINTVMNLIVKLLSVTNNAINYTIDNISTSISNAIDNSIWDEYKSFINMLGMIDGTNESEETNKIVKSLSKILDKITELSNTLSASKAKFREVIINRRETESRDSSNSSESTVSSSELSTKENSFTAENPAKEDVALEGDETVKVQFKDLKLYEEILKEVNTIRDRRKLYLPQLNRLIGTQGEASVDSNVEYVNANDDVSNLDGIPYTSPLKNVRITSDFGYRFHPIEKKYKLHKGIDYGAPEGEPVYAIGAGEVVTAGWDPTGGGNMVKIRHLDNYSSGYLHLSEILVKVGQILKGGERIGSVGSTGRSTGNHLHMQLKDPSGNPSNPHVRTKMVIPKKNKQTA